MPFIDDHKIKLFYSYCHEDRIYRNSLEKGLSTLKHNGLIENWHDEEITAGQIISVEIERKMNESDVILFLVSPDFLASESCIAEWNMAKKMT